MLDFLPEQREPLGSVTLHRGEALDAYSSWSPPTCIISDGPYGVGGYPGDPKTPRDLPVIYGPHVRAWSEFAMPRTTLWFWNTELGWALTHPVLVEHGWDYRGCNIWDKGVGHIAGNCNGLTMRKFPVVTEVCAHYVRRPVFHDRAGGEMTMQAWLRAEWKRTGLPFNKANEACGVKNAATRKYLTSDHMFYEPPPEVFGRLVTYANEHGDPAGRPYFDIAGREAINASTRWEQDRAKFRFEYGATNVWSVPANRGRERLKVGGKAVHNNQKPGELLRRIIAASTDPGDVVWDPFCGTGAVALTAAEMGRDAFGAEMNSDYADLVEARIADRVEFSAQFGLNRPG